MFQNNLLQGKRILITGGGTGLGKATAQRFLELGAEMYICGRRHEVLAATEQELRDTHRWQDSLPSLRRARRSGGRRDDRNHLGRRTARCPHE